MSLLRHPDIFGRAVGWDVGIRVDTGPIEESDRAERIAREWGTVENFDKYRISSLIRSRGKELGGEARLFYYNVEGTADQGERSFTNCWWNQMSHIDTFTSQSASIVGIAVGCQRRFSFWWTQLNEKIVARFSIAFSAIYRVFNQSITVRLMVGLTVPSQPQA